MTASRARPRPSRAVPFGQTAVSFRRAWVSQRRLPTFSSGSVPTPTGQSDDAMTFRTSIAITGASFVAIETTKLPPLQATTWLQSPEGQ